MQMVVDVWRCIDDLPINFKEIETIFSNGSYINVVESINFGNLSQFLIFVFV